MVKHVWDYPWSSAAYHVGRRDTDPLIKDRVLSPSDMKSMLLKAVDEDNDLEERTRTGRPCGADRFIELAEQITGMDLKKKKAGRPKNEN